MVSNYNTFYPFFLSSYHLQRHNRRIYLLYCLYLNFIERLYIVFILLLDFTVLSVINLKQQSFILLHYGLHFVTGFYHFVTHLLFKRNPLKPIWCTIDTMCTVQKHQDSTVSNCISLYPMHCIQLYRVKSLNNQKPNP